VRFVVKSLDLDSTVSYVLMRLSKFFSYNICLCFDRMNVRKLVQKEWKNEYTLSELIWDTWDLFWYCQWELI